MTSFNENNAATPFSHSWKYISPSRAYFVCVRVCV